MTLPAVPASMQPSPAVLREYSRLIRLARRIAPDECEAFFDDLRVFVADGLRTGGWIELEVTRAALAYRDGVAARRTMRRSWKSIAGCRDITQLENQMFAANRFREELKQLTLTAGIAGKESK